MSVTPNVTPKVTAIIQSRMGSSRLPGKSMRLLAGKPLIMHIVERARACRVIDQVVVATTTNAEDDPLADWLRAQGVLVTRGSAEDVLVRYVQAASEFGGDVIVRITGDDPLKDPAVMESVIRHYLEHAEQYDYVSNTIRPTYPEGQDVEVFSAKTLMQMPAWTQDAYDHEHVTPFLYRNPERFRCFNVVYTEDLSGLRWTLDTADDWQFFERIFAELGHDHLLSMAEVLDLLRRQPEIAEINAAVRRSAQYRTNPLAKG